MCGVAGLAVGVEVGSACVLCPRRAAADGTPPADRAARWHATSGVRTGPIHGLSARSLDADIFPLDRVPVGASALVRELPAATHRLLGARHLYRYLQFTAELEIRVVNRVAGAMALGRAPFPVTSDLRIAAAQIYTDEAYHALVALTLADEVGRLADYAAPSVWVGVERRLERIIQAHPDLPADHVRMLFVSVSETLITGNLRDLTTAVGLDEGARRAISEHARDEGRHHALFRDLLPLFWDAVPARHRAGLLALVPDLVLCFFAPEREAVARELIGYGLSPRQVRQVVEETYRPEMIRRTAIDSSEQTLRYLAALPGADHAGLAGALGCAPVAA